MLGDQTASYVDDIDIAGALDAFYADDDAVELAGTLAQDAEELGLDVA